MENSFTKRKGMDHIQTWNKSSWVNTCEYIILHHTGTWPWSKQWLINAATWDRQVSFHYLVDEHGGITKIWEHTDILWHAWESEWDWKDGMNSYSIGVEVIGPWFTKEQRDACSQLIPAIMMQENIPKENVLRHAHISPGRKWDIAEEFYSPHGSREDYQNYLSVLANLMGFYEKLWQEECGDVSWDDRVFKDPEGAYKRIKDLSPDQQLKEMIYLQALLLQRLK